MADSSGLFGLMGNDSGINAANIIRSRYRQPIAQAAMENADTGSIRATPPTPFESWLNESGQRLMNPTDTIAQGVQNFTQQDPVDMGMSLFGGGLGTIKATQTAGELAQKLAHDRAMLPVSEHGLGLPAGNTAMDRAKAMEFNTTAYHGRVMDDVTNNTIPKAIRGGSVGDAYLTSDPKVSSSYAMTTTPTNNISNIELAKSIHGYAPTNYPLLVRAGRVLNENHDIYDIIKPTELADNLSQYTSKLDNRELFDDTYLKELSNNVLDQFTPEYSGSSMPANLSRLFGYLEESPAYKPDLYKKFDSLTYDDLEAGGKTIVPFSQDNIRSRFAAFDPWRRNAAIAALTGTAAPDLMAGENDNLVNALRSK